MSPREAVARIAHISRRVNRRANWPGWLFLAIAVTNAAMFVAIASSSQAVSRGLGAMTLLPGVAILAFAARQPVIARDTSQISRPVLAAGIATNVAGLVLYQTALPQHFTGWLVALAIAMQSPLVVGTWCWLRR